MRNSRQKRGILQKVLFLNALRAFQIPNIPIIGWEILEILLYCIYILINDNKNDERRQIIEMLKAPAAPDFPWTTTPPSLLPPPPVFSLHHEDYIRINKILNTLDLQCYNYLIHISFSKTQNTHYSHGLVYWLDKWKCPQQVCSSLLQVFTNKLNNSRKIFSYYSTPMTR